MKSIIGGTDDSKEQSLEKIASSLASIDKTLKEIASSLQDISNRQ